MSVSEPALLHKTFEIQEIIMQPFIWEVALLTTLCQSVR